MEVAAVSLEQGHSQVSLESLYLLAERGLRDVQPLRTAATKYSTSRRSRRSTRHSRSIIIMSGEASGAASLRTSIDTGAACL